MQRIITMRKKPYRLAMGLMSGTSADGIDTALVKIAGHGLNTKIELLGYHSFDYSTQDKSLIQRLFDYEHCNIPYTSFMNFRLGELFAAAVINGAAKFNVPLDDIDFIGSHGQTVFHQPQPSSVDGVLRRSNTLQIGDPAIIAHLTGHVTIGDFRVADVAAGGNGAPLVPYTEYILYGSSHESRALQNIGGIANVTVIPQGCTIDEVYAFDTGPGNMIMDGLMHHFTQGKLSYDIDGCYAAQGQISEPLVNILCSDPYFTEPPPKTTGREQFGGPYLTKILDYATEHNLSKYDVLASVTDFTARTIKQSFERFIFPKTIINTIVISGGGTYNPTLMKMLRHYFEGISILTQEDIGGNSDAKEAIAFAILGNETLFGTPNNMPKVTGAQKGVVMGKICL